MQLLLSAETRKEIAGSVTYINVLSTCATIVFSWVLRTTGDTQILTSMGIFWRRCPYHF